MKKVNICGVNIDNVSLQETLDIFDQFVRARKPVSVVTPNVDHIVKLNKDAEFRGIYSRASLVLADGVPLLWASYLLGTPIKEKVSGSDLFPRVCELAAKKGWRLFFMGGREGAAAKAAEILCRLYPGLKVAGTYSPAFGFEKDDKENAKIIAMIKAAKPDILFIGLGAPKQEKWTDRFMAQHGVPVSIGVGVSFEFMAGMVKRAPRWMQKYGFEWFWRLMMEPGRLWKRYLIEDIAFFGLLFRQKFSK